jgi:hypothetical protein
MSEAQKSKTDSEILAALIENFNKMDRMAKVALVAHSLAFKDLYPKEKSPVLKLTIRTGGRAGRVD